MTRKLNISFFENYTNTTAKEKEYTIDEFYILLQRNITKTKEQNYKQLNIDIEKIKKQEIFSFIPLFFKDKRRHNDSMSISKRCMITINIDSFACTLEEVKTELHSKFSNLYYIAYSTAKSTTENPRFRVLFFLNNDFSVTTKQEQDLYSKKVKAFCKKYFGDKFKIDNASYQSNRLMLLPFFFNEEPFLHINVGDLVDLESIEIEEPEKQLNYKNQTPL